MDRKKYLSTLIIGICISAVIVFACIFLFNGIEEAQAKTTVYEAFSKAYEEFVEEDVDITKIFKVYENDQYCHEGDLILSDVELMDNQIINLIENIPVKYSVACKPETKLVVSDISLFEDSKDLESEDKIHLMAYIDEKDVTFKIDKFYDRYLSVPNSDIKETFNESPWYSLLGDMLSLVPDNYSFDFYTEDSLSQMVVSDIIEEYIQEGSMKELAEDISVKKADEQKDFLVGDTYIATNIYNIKVPKKVFGKELRLVAYISDDSRLRGIAYNTTAVYEEEEYDVEVLVSFKNNEHLFERIIIDMTVKESESEEIYNFRSLINNTKVNNESYTTLIVSLQEPKVTRLFEMELVRNIDTNEFSADIAAKFTGFEGWLTYSCRAYDDEIIMPEDDLEIYELNLWQILNIYSEANWSFMK